MSAASDLSTASKVFPENLIYALLISGLLVMALPLEAGNGGLVGPYMAL